MTWRLTCWTPGWGRWRWGFWSAGRWGWGEGWPPPQIWLSLRMEDTCKNDRSPLNTEILAFQTLYMFFFIAILPCRFFFVFFLSKEIPIGKLIYKTYPHTISSTLTDGQPCLLGLQVNVEVGGEANVRYGSRLFLVVVIFPVAVPNSCKKTVQQVRGSSGHGMMQISNLFPVIQYKYINFWRCNLTQNQKHFLFRRKDPGVTLVYIISSKDFCFTCGTGFLSKTEV